MLSNVVRSVVRGQPKLARRALNLHEYQAKQVMDKFGVASQRWRVATTPAEAARGAEELKPWCVTGLGGLFRSQWRRAGGGHLPRISGSEAIGGF